MDPCVQLCNDLGASYGIEVVKFGATIGGFVFLWLRNRKTDQKAVAADEKAATATEQAAKAKTELRAARMSLARIEGSMRPAAIILPETPVPDVSLHGDVKLPPAARVPKEEE